MKGLKPLLFLLACCPALLFFGCKKADEVQPPRTFSVLYNQRENSPFQPDWLILEEYKNRKNTLLDVRLGDDSDYENSISRVFDSGNIPNIILKVWPETIEKYASAGLLLPISDYETQMPYYNRYIEGHALQKEVDSLKQENGKYYLLPGYQRPIQVQQWIYRKDLFQKHNIAPPDNYEAMLEALVQLKQEYPDSAPLTATWGGAHLFAMMGAGYGIPAGWNGNRHFDDDAGTWLFAPATENYREMYRFLHRCYDAGVLDEGVFTQTDSEYYGKIQDGRAIITVTWISSGFDNWNTALEENGVSNGEWAPLPVPESTVGIRAVPAVNRFRKGLALSAAAVKDPGVSDLLEFLDWAVYSEEGMTLTAWGVEGTTYSEGPDGKRFLPHIKTPKNPEGEKEMTADYGLSTLFDLNENEEYENYKKPPEIVSFLHRSLANGETAVMDPPLRLNSDEIEAIRIVEEQCAPYASESGKAFITGDLDIDSEWETYLAELENRGYTTLEEIWNAAWKKQNN